MKKINLFMLVLIGLITSSCLKDTEIKMSEKMEVVIKGYVYDYETTKPLNEAKIKTDVDSVLTDKNGYYEITGLNMGQHRLTIEAPGYLSVIERPDVLMGKDELKGNKYIKLVETYLSKGNKKLSTKLISANGPVYAPYSNKPFELHLGSYYAQPIINGVTDAEGRVVVNNLPATTVTLHVNYTDSVNGVRYYLNEQGIYPENPNANYNVYAYNAAQESLYLTYANLIDEDGETTDMFPVDENIVLKFNTAIDQEATEVNLSKSGYDILVNVTYPDNKTMELNPLGNSLESGTSYRLAFQVVSTDGENQYFNQFYFETEGSESTGELSAIAGIELTSPDVITDNTRTVTFEVICDSETDDMEVFGSYPAGGVTEFVEMNNYSYWENTDENKMSVRVYLDDLSGIEIPSDGIFANGNDFKLIFRATDYSGKKSPYSNIVELKKAK